MEATTSHLYVAVNVQTSLMAGIVAAMAQSQACYFVLNPVTACYFV